MSESYHQRRSEIGAYFDRTAAEAWKRLTSDMPVGRIRATVRAGRDAMRSELLSYLPEDLKGARVLDAGCGTGAMSQALAERGAEVVAVDLSPQLVKVAEDRTPQHLLSRIHYRAGDMTSPQLGRFDFCVAMDSVIHYEQHDMVACLAKLAERTETAIAFTFAPSTTLLEAMHKVGKLFPRGNRSPAIVPQKAESFRHLLHKATGMVPRRNRRISSGFYISHAQELIRP
ncbi:magnesium protoporphyrin IX methyltransferase [Aestuariivirga sp.]|uniref:magnesium protoporphyrin IX methyltransferase n=1 Tax=Aestuariivirga sp. TaxID=2650926 RepID=UPI0039E6F2A4